MKPKLIKALTEKQLAALSTPRLLALLSKLQQCEDSVEKSDWSSEEILDTDGIVFKSSDEWLQQYTLVKSILSNRENVE